MRPQLTRLLLLPLLLGGCAPPRQAAPPSPAGGWRQLEFALLEDYDKGADLELVRGDFRVMKELGVTTWRGSFGWDDYEPEPGAYDFEWLRRFVRLAEQEGIRLRPYLGYTPGWAGSPGGGQDGQAWNDPPRELGPWRAFVRRMATEFARSPALLSWEIYNEENAPQWFEGTVDQYAGVLAAASQEIRRAAPRAQVVLGGLTYPDVDWLGALCTKHRLGADFDVAALHVYAETWPPEKRVEDVHAGADYGEEFLGTLREDCGRKPVWVNETGYATRPGHTEAQQAAWWARAIATFAADTAVSFVGIYETRDLARGAAVIGEPENFYLGLRRADGTPKQAFGTVKLLVRLLGGPFRILDPGVAPAAGGDVVAHAFLRRDGHRVLLAWTRGRQATTLRWPPATSGRRLIQYSVAGLPLRTLSGGPVELTLAPDDVVILAEE